ncbi:hypothetical protein CAPTEDRAFT_221835 [Capitella teleta]|uniref:Uncharacterized protein n=1 Tax=Capitella teleta TaxID=283909 RepID=R7VCG6_CAPTE|nr:hypothetical protein CAPTEDRAFT_221835 [Capitella teleta]|eukprot:ELU16232.1 hypothetical protein CAPTEDRAFT_221835 [Capitella teleta]
MDFFIIWSIDRGPGTSKKVFLILLVICGFILYAWPNWMTFGAHSPHHLDPLDLCIESKLEKFRTKVESYDAVVNHFPPFEGEKTFVSYIGNGHIATAISPESNLYIKHGRTVSVPIKFYPIISINIDGYKSSEAHVTDIRSGLVYRVQCFEAGSGYCINAASQFYVHKTRPSVLIQEFRIENPTDRAVTIDMDQIGVSDWEGVTTWDKRTNTGRRSNIDYTLSVGTVPLVDISPDLVLVVAVANVKLPETVTVNEGSTWKAHIPMVVRFSEEPVRKSTVKDHKQRLQELVEKDINTVLNIDDKMLRQEHMKVWMELWHSGFGISQSLAAGAINGDDINMTLYYVLSNSPSPIHEVERSESDRFELAKLLYFPNRCFEDHQTLQTPRLWSGASTVSALLSVVRTWFITLEKWGCETMLKAGADGVLQAAILSIGALKFSNDHLEFNTHPKDLHRDYFFRRINYGNNTHLNISVIVGDDNKAVLYASLDRNDKPYYACDAGCLDQPVSLSREIQYFPVKLTDPVTAILYITADRQHMQELREAIHFKGIAEAPAHQHHVMALHKHGHHYGGLPMLFWGSIAILITIFHMFLFKLIFNEYCQGTEGRYSRGKYNL